jgi:REP element-mobilizing transposase RayT
MSYNNLRKGRVSAPFHYYFVTVVTRDRIPYFTDFYLARELINSMRYFHEQNFINSLSWVLMPDHLHWLFQLADGLDLSEFVRRLKGKSSRLLNEQLGRQGGFWQPGFYDRALRKDEDLREIARYLVANPLRAGLVERLEEYSHWDAMWL